MNIDCRPMTDAELLDHIDEENVTYHDAGRARIRAARSDEPTEQSDEGGDRG